MLRSKALIFQQALHPCQFTDREGHDQELSIAWHRYGHVPHQDGGGFDRHRCYVGYCELMANGCGGAQNAGVIQWDTNNLTNTGTYTIEYCWMDSAGYDCFRRREAVSISCSNTATSPTRSVVVIPMSSNSWSAAPPRRCGIIAFIPPTGRRGSARTPAISLRVSQVRTSTLQRAATPTLLLAPGSTLHHTSSSTIITANAVATHLLTIHRLPGRNMPETIG